MLIHIKFTEDGIPGWFGPAPIDGSEVVDLTGIGGDPIPFLASHRRVNGEWVLRDPVKPVELTAEEIAAETEAEAAAQAEAEAARQEAIEMEIVRLSGPDQLLRSMGKITIAELGARVAAIRTQVEGAA